MTLVATQKIANAINKVSILIPPIKLVIKLKDYIRYNFLISIGLRNK